MFTKGTYPILEVFCDKYFLFVLLIEETLLKARSRAIAMVSWNDLASGKPTIEPGLFLYPYFLLISLSSILQSFNRTINWLLVGEGTRVGGGVFYFSSKLSLFTLLQN